MIQELIPIIGIYRTLLIAGYRPHEVEKFLKEVA